MLIVSSIRLMLDLLVLRVPRPCLYMLGSSTPVVFERKNLSHPIITWCFETMNFCNSAHLGRTQFLSWNFSEGSSYKATAELRKIRCIKDKHHMQSKYVTWYGHHHLVLLISIILIFYQRVVTWSSHQLLLLQLLLSHSDKVKKLYGACILCN